MKKNKKNTKAALKREIETLKSTLEASENDNNILRTDLSQARGQVNQLQAELRGLQDQVENVKHIEKEFDRYRRDAMDDRATLKAEHKGAQNAFITALQIVSANVAKNSGHADRGDLPPDLEGLDGSRRSALANLAEIFERIGAQGI